MEQKEALLTRRNRTAQHKHGVRITIHMAQQIYQHGLERTEPRHPLLKSQHAKVSVGERRVEKP
jgi:hypothetical protein